MDKKYKIIECIDNFMPDISSAIRAVNNYAKILTEDGNAVTVATLGTKEDVFDYLPYSVVYSGTANSCGNLYKQLSGGDWDVIHVHSFGKILDMALKLAKAKNIPIVATVHSNFIAKLQMKYGDGLRSKAKIGRIIAKYNKCDEVFVTSPYVLQYLRKYGYIGKASYMPLASDLTCDDRKEDLIKVANKLYDLSARDNVLVSIGNLRATKRLDFAIEALNAVKKAGVDFRYFVVGKGEELSHLQELVKKYHLTKQVTFLGYVPDDNLCPLLARAQLLLLPTTYDFFGLSKVECAGFGTPGVYIRDSFVSNEVFDHIDGYTSLNRVEDYANAIVSALQDREGLKTVSSGAYTDLYITWDKCTDILLSRVSEIADTFTPRPKTLRLK